jgi:leukocyte elastase inhibitor
VRARAINRWAVFTPLLIAAIQPAEAGGERVRTLTDAYNASGQALFREFARLPGNIVLSPYSIGVAMAMVRSGARGDTEQQMASVLNNRQSREQTDAANAALLAILNSYDRSSQPDYCPKGAQWTGEHCEAPPAGDRRCPLTMQLEREGCVGQPVGPSAKLVAANALMLTKPGGVISEEYKATVRDKYAAAIYEGAGLEEVNGWVKRKTDGKIDQILDWLDPDAVSVLLNAVYLKAGWASAFVKSATHTDDFKLSVSERVRVPMMRQQAWFRLEERVGYRAIRLDYTERSLGMIIVLPNEVDGLDMVTRELDAEVTYCNSISVSEHVVMMILALARNYGRSLCRP